MTAGMFAGGLVPNWAVTPFAWAIPPIEVVLGGLLIAGLFTRTALITSGVWMIALLVGSNLIE